MQYSWNTSEAYDLSMYETEETAPARRPHPAADKKTEHRLKVKAAQRTLSRRLVVCGVLLVLFLAMLLFHNVAVVELGDSIQSAAEELSVLESEYSYLCGKLPGQNSSEVEDYAAANGLCKVQPYQVSYISLSEGDQAVRTEHAPTGSPIEALMNRMDTVLEYLKIK